MNYATLVSELRDDPLARGYAGLTDAECAASLNAQDRLGPKRDLTRREILESVPIAEFAAFRAAVSAGNESAVVLDYYLSAEGSVALADNSNGEEVLLAAFGADRLALLRGLASTTTSRAAELALEVVGDGHVRSAREMF